MADDNITEEADTGQQQLVIFSDENTAFEFLKLAEIRNKIYWNVLVGVDDCYFFFQPPLTLVNKQIRSESLPVLYGNNKFIVYCADGHYLDESMWNFPKFRRRFKTPPRVPAVSTLLSVDLVTKLDLRYSIYTDEHDEFDAGVDIDIYMRNNRPRPDPISSEEYEDCMIGQSGGSLKSSADIRRIFSELLQSCSIDMDWSPKDPFPQRVFGDLGTVVKCLLFLARKCPSATGWVEIWVSASQWENEEFYETCDFDLLVSGSEGSESQESGSEGCGSEESGSEDADAVGGDD